MRSSSFQLSLSHVGCVFWFQKGLTLATFLLRIRVWLAVILFELHLNRKQRHWRHLLQIIAVLSWLSRKNGWVLCGTRCAWIWQYFVNIPRQTKSRYMSVVCMHFQSSSHNYHCSISGDKLKTIIDYLAAISLAYIVRTERFIDNLLWL